VVSSAVFFLGGGGGGWGKGGKCVMHLSDILPPDLPTKTLPRRCSPATSRYEKSTVGPVLGSKSTKRFSDQMVLRARCLFILLPPSMKRDAFQLFVIKSFMSLSSSAFVSSVAMSWLFIAFLFLDFHMAHTIIEIRMRSLSESLLFEGECSCASD
jgi:hypothetical protein